MATSSDPATELSTQENTALITQEITSGARDKTWASGKDWDRHRTQITQLYQMKPLIEVMRIMDSELGFKATPRMYKTRIHDWGLDKNKKESEMRAVVRKRDQRERQGKSSVFYVRDRFVDFGEIVRYWERKGMSIEDVVAQRGMSATPDAVVECSTPVPSPPSTPEEFAIPDNVIRCVRDYYQGSFESRTWISKDERMFCTSIKAHDDTHKHLDFLHDQCRLSCQLFAQFQYQEAGRTLICATASIKKILQLEDPETLSTLFSIVIRIAYANRLEIAIAVLRQFAALGELIVGGGHPISRVCRWLASLKSSLFQDVLMVCFQSASDNFEHFLGPMHTSTFSCRLDYAMMIDRAPNTGQEESVTEKLLATCIQNVGSSDPRFLDCCLTLSDLHEIKGDYIAAQRVARDIIQYAQNVEPREYLPHFRSCGLHLLAVSQHNLGEMPSAEANLRQAIELRMSFAGTADGHARTWLVELEDWVAEQGNLAYAAQIQDWRCQILSSIEMEEQ